MQTMAWTDERLEERFDAIALRFDLVDRRFDEVDRRLIHLEAGMRDLQSVLSRVGGGIIVTLFGVIAAILVKGG